ncbi:PREDICTED: uncharacterized protein K02A2.6-like [Rhagoletis zephyria]|uniref:uncharacterized protein K02A2.6-like n=1 Tax=Rhagoletis zephyria TaxID=28612 RepID=UPI0008113B1D|nr:PREDICTED: uncharacterized protein K02A2.6-like [Rhagoletis zephyria]
MQLNTTKTELVSYCGTPLECLGYSWVRVSIERCDKILKLYVVRSDRKPLLGRKWLREIRLDWNKIINNDTVIVQNVNQIQQNQRSSQIENLISKYSDVFSTTTGKIKDLQARLYLKPNAAPKFVKHRRVPFPLMEAVEKQLDAQVAEGLLKKVETSEWATPIVVVLKKGGGVRICGDYKVTLNPVLLVDEHPLPTVDELFSKMAGGVRFSKIDLATAYLQLEVHPDDRHLLTLNTHRGLYQPNRMMFGIASTPAKWQRLMEQAIGDIPGVSVFLDDIKVTAPDDDTHIQRVEEVLKRLDHYNMHVNLEKSQFLKDSIEYCGYVISKEGIRRMSNKIQAIQNMKVPTNREEVRAFMGLVNYYGRFVKNLSDIVHPINRLLLDKVTWSFDKKCKVAFEEIKKQMQSNVILAHYDSKLPITLAVDASPIGVGAVLSHMYEDGTERPIQFASQTLSKVQQRYSQLDKEAYAIIFGIHNRAISQIFSPGRGIPINSATPTYEQVEEVYVVEEELFENLPVTVAELQRETKADETIRRLYEGLKYGRKCEAKDRFGIEQHEFTLHNDCILRGVRVYIPNNLRQRVLDELHTAHFGVVRMKSLARAYVWWYQMHKDIENVVQKCIACQVTRPDPKRTMPVHSWKTPGKVFERVHVDYAGPVMGKYLFILIDAFSKWPEVHLTSNMTTETTVEKCREIFAQFGVTNVLVSDHGRQFNSTEFQKFLKENGVIHKQGAPYHPATNGQAERYVQTIKNKLIAANCTPESLKSELSKILIAYRRTIHPVTNKSPSMLMLGRQIQTRLDLLLPQNDQAKFGKTLPTKRIDIGERVAVRDYLSKPKWKFGVVEANKGDLHYSVRLDDGRKWTRHIDQMRRSRVSIDDTPEDSSKATGMLAGGPVSEQMGRAQNHSLSSHQTPDAVTNHSSQSSSQPHQPVEAPPEETLRGKGGEEANKNLQSDTSQKPTSTTTTLESPETMLRRSQRQHEESCIQTIKDKENQEIERNNLTTLIGDHLNKMTITIRDRFIRDTLHSTKTFLKNNDQLLILNADKGNVTVMMEKSEYDTKMQKIVIDISTYRALKRDPTNKLQAKSNEIVEKMYTNKVIDLK